MPAPVLVHLAGLILMSFQIEPGRLIGVAPIVPCPAARSNVVLGPSSSADDAMQRANVEGHAVTLAISSGGYVSNDFGWTHPLDNSGRPFLLLNGERVRFIPSPIKRDPRTAVRNMVDAPVLNETGDLGLPHIACCKNTQLWDAYMPPYRLAAAVVDLYGGQPKVCDSPYQRLDTEAQFENGGSLTIELIKGSVKKHIVVNSGTTVFIANMPQAGTPGLHPCGWNPNISHPNKRPAIDEDGIPHEPDHRPALAAMVKLCSGAPDPDQCPQRDSQHCSQTYPAMTALCSNNQWP